MRALPSIGKGRPPVSCLVLGFKAAIWWCLALQSLQEAGFCLCVGCRWLTLGPY